MYTSLFPTIYKRQPADLESVKLIEAILHGRSLRTDLGMPGRAPLGEWGCASS